MKENQTNSKGQKASQVIGERLAKLESERAKKAESMMLKLKANSLLLNNL